MNLNQAKEAKQEVETLLRSAPRLHGLKRSRWRLTDIRDHITWLCDKSLAGVKQILERLGFSWKQTISFVRSPDPAYQRKLAWLEAVKWQVQLVPQHYVLLYQDEFSYYQQPRGTRRYWPTGTSYPKHYYVPGGNKLSRIGATMDGLTGQVVYHQGDKFGVEAMCQLYHKVRATYPRRHVFVAQDNCPFHKHPQVMQTVRELDIIPAFFPTYSSWMNPIEKLWRWLRTDILNGHHLAHSLSTLRQTVASFLDQFSDASPALLRYVGLLLD
ncbi:MAG: IS630 family transposase [Anaerolineae bacterium]|nr:IS630 family transposase [Anaerolineae bacterium]